MKLPIVIIDRPKFRFRALKSKAALKYQKFQLDETDSEKICILKPPAWLFLTQKLSDKSSTKMRRLE